MYYVDMTSNLLTGDVTVATKEIKRIEGNLNLTNAIAAAIKAVHEAGLSSDDVKATLERFTTLLEED
jgi:hypothetical protein